MAPAAPRAAAGASFIRGRSASRPLSSSFRVSQFFFSFGVAQRNGRSLTGLLTILIGPEPELRWSTESLAEDLPRHADEMKKKK